MATKIKFVSASDFLEITPEGTINLATSRQLLVEIAKTDHPPADYDLLIDFRDTHWHMSTLDLYNLAGELIKYGDTFRGKVALLVFTGDTFRAAEFFETCSHNRGFSVDAFVDYESAIRWLLAADAEPDPQRPPGAAAAGAERPAERGS